MCHIRKKSVSYLETALNQINTEGEGEPYWLFPLPLLSFSLSYFPIFFSLEMVLYSEGDMP